MDGNDITKSFLPDRFMQGYYSGSSINGVSHGYLAGFNIHDFTDEMTIVFGQLTLQPPRIPTFSEFRSLFDKGEKVYDSLIVPGQLNTNRIEINYFDESGIGWSTTSLSIDSAGKGVRNVIQPNSKFFVDNVKDVVVMGKNGLRIEGRFNCILYEVYGVRQKQITNGDFLLQIGKPD